MKSLLFCTLPILFASLSTFAQNTQKENKKEIRYQEILEIVGSEVYQFSGRKANPQGGRQIDLTTRENYLRIREGSASADIPYFGRSFSDGYSSSGGGIKFDGPMETYSVDKNDKKRRLTIKFKVKGTNDVFSCTLSVSSKETVSLTVSSNKRQVINYTGTIKALETE